MEVQRMATTINARYELDLSKPLGEGAFGQVVRGVDVQNSKRPVAVKIINTEHFSIANIEQEVEVMRALRNPYIVEVLECHHEPTEGKAYVVMELVDGQELFDRVTLNDVPQGHLAEAHALPHFRDLASAVAFCHAQGIAHRDLKLDNVLITRDGALKLIDFGLAARIDPCKCNSQGQWDDGGFKEICGTRSYAA